MTRPLHAAAPLSDTEWWRGAVIYQIYPRSFADANGDGIGDLPGILRHLDHVASLGVDAIWLSPFFTSPMMDFGYDIADYRDVDPIFGTLADFDALVVRAHALGLRVIIDQVYAHTSDRHPWFLESRASRDNARADWYLWADAKPEGSPPNNWQSVFGGPAWTWDARRCQYYAHNFLSAQPQLNGHHPAVQTALIAVARFWLGRGVDGFRLDAINFLMFDAALTDNPPAPDNGTPRTRPFDFQLRVHNQSQPEIAGFLERLRGALDEYGACFTVAEVGGAAALSEMKAFTAPGRLDTAYSFDFLYAPALTPVLVRDVLGAWGDGDGWPSWAFENHDAPRALSRWAPADADAEAAAAFARVKILLLACLRGNVFLYNGEELGLPQVEIGFADLRDPEAIANWPLTLSRDGARTPMPWCADAPAMGFTSGTPWLPLGAGHAALAVDRQQTDPDSLLHFTQRALAVRQTSPALRLGAMRFVEVGEAVLAFERGAGRTRRLCVFNLRDAAVDWTPPPGRWRTVLATDESVGWSLPPFTGIVAEPME